MARFYVLSIALLSGCELFVNTEVGKPLGEPCESDGQCQAAKCVNGLCARECTGDAQCRQGTRCVDQQCRVANCTATQDCVRDLGDFYVCRRPDQVCVNLRSQDCDRVVGEYTSDDAIFFGTVFPLSGSNVGIGRTQTNAIELAQYDFHTAGDLPPINPGGAKRPIVLVECDDKSDVNVAVRAARHLVHDVHVPAINGTSLSGTSLEVATKVTIPNGVFQIAPSTTSTVFTNLQDDGLYWRSVSVITSQNVALAKVYAELLEPNLRVKLGLQPGEKMKLAVVHKNDAWGSTSATDLQKVIMVNNAPPGDDPNSYVRLSYGNPSDPVKDPPRYKEVAADVVRMAPHVIIIFATNEVLNEMIPSIENGWTETKYRPTFLSSWGLATKELFNYVKTNNGPDDSLRQRFLLAVFGANGNNWKTFKVLYNSSIHDGTIPESFGASQAYDQMYVMTYAAYSILDGNITGTKIAANVSRLVSGPIAPVGLNSINPTLARLKAGDSIDLDGASGELNFNLATGDLDNEVQMTCMPLNAAGEIQPPTYTGVYYNVLGEKIGTFQAMSDFCKFTN